ncbi:MAG: D-alanyl-D-alanine carboxypeptidase [Lachnospiraceae bacterium]|nr:D-alanyl-D-alanine carboxypeptidase [Lachnospiraceae bacterium]
MTHIRKHNKKIAFLLIAAACLLLTGCTERQDVENAYGLYDTTETYVSFDESSFSSELSLFASDLCVGGTENTESDSVIADCAKSAALFIVDSEEIAYAQNIYEKAYPASTTKILTAYIALKYGDPDEVLTVSDEAIDDLDPSSSVCGLQKGDQITLRNALYGLMLCSGNDAANVIAEAISGSTDAFADLMNEEALALGATHSHFVNPHGLPDDDHYTTAYDLYLIFQEAIQNEDFVSIISTLSYNASYLDASGNTVTQTWTNTNGYLTGAYSQPDGVTVIGGKTGTTSAAGYCLVLYSQNEDSSPVISIVLNGNSRSDMYKIMTQMLSTFGNG